MERGMPGLKMKLALCVTLVGLAVLWFTFIALPIQSVRHSQAKLQQYWVTYRLVSIGFTAEQASEAIHGLEPERLERLAGNLGTNVPGAALVTVIGGLLGMLLLGLILLI
jgi:hypothetical protein